MKVSLLSYPYHASKHTGRGHDRYVAELVDNTRGQAGVELTVIDPGFAKNTLQYAAATVMVFPSHYGFGLSTLEAMACGTHVVGRGRAGCPRILR